MEKVSSGVEGFDQLIYGGFPKGRSYLVAGEPGTGKTIFLLQFLLQGIKEGEKGIYISIDEKPEQIVADALALGWDLSPQLEKGMLQIIDVTSYFSSIKHSDGSVINIDDIVKLFKSCSMQNTADRSTMANNAYKYYTENFKSNIIVNKFLKEI